MVMQADEIAFYWREVMIRFKRYERGKKQERPYWEQTAWAGWKNPGDRNWTWWGYKAYDWIEIKSQNTSGTW